MAARLSKLGQVRVGNCPHRRNENYQQDLKVALGDRSKAAVIHLYRLLREAKISVTYRESLHRTRLKVLYEIPLFQRALDALNEDNNWTPLVVLYEQLGYYIEEM